MLKYLILFNIIFLISLLSYSQPVSIDIQLGPIVRLPVSKLYDNPNLPVSTYANLAGLGLNTGLNLKIKKINIGFGYDITSRYDYLYSDYSRISPNGLTPDAQKLLIEHNLTIIKYFDKIYVGLGASLLNTGQSFNYYEKSINMETLTYDFSLGTSIWKLFYEAKLKYISQTYDPIPYGRFMFLESKLYFPIKIVK